MLQPLCSEPFELLPKDLVRRVQASEASGRVKTTCALLTSLLLWLLRTGLLRLGAVTSKVIPPAAVVTRSDTCIGQGCVVTIDFHSGWCIRCRCESLR